MNTKPLNYSQMAVLTALVNNNMSMNELIQETGLSDDGIRGRMSELRNQYHLPVIRKGNAYHIAIENVCKCCMSKLQAKCKDCGKIHPFSDFIRHNE